MTRAAIKTDIRSNLWDAGVTFYSQDDLNDSVQDAYDDIVILSKCIIRKVNRSFLDDVTYYDAATDLGISDYLGMTAIFNNRTKRWLDDNISLRQLDNIRSDWETWTGSPEMWVPVTTKKFAIIPKITGSGMGDGAFTRIAFSSAFFIGSSAGMVDNTFDLYYWALAPTLVNDNSTFLIAPDMNGLVEYYSTADLLEQAQEFVKAEGWWIQYYQGVEEYRERCANLAKSDLLLRV
jgi:hypothetical protein